MWEGDESRSSAMDLSRSEGVYTGEGESEDSLGVIVDESSPEAGVGQWPDLTCY